MKQDLVYLFSAIVRTNDEGVLHCLRALSHYARSAGKKMKAWGGTTKGERIRNKHCVKFYFSNPAFREKF